MIRPSLGDTEFETKTVKRVEKAGDYYQVTWDDGWCLAVKKSYGIIPKVGDEAHLYGQGIGRPVRGLVIAGKTVYYRTPAEEEVKEHEELEVNINRKKAEFERDKAKLDAEYDALPAVFRERLDKFRDTNPNFRWEFESYEMFCCKEALVVAAALKTPEAVQKFWKAHGDSKSIGMSDQHSGNTWGKAMSFAYWYLEDPTMVPKLHGALVELVGCDAYGCPHPVRLQGASK